MAASVDHTNDAQIMPSGVSILPPAPDEMLGRRTTALPPHLICAVACHGGAGTSTLAALLDHVGDSGPLWPARTDEPPFVVLVARDSARGLAAASIAARQFHTGNAPTHVRLLGLVLVAARRGKPAESTRRLRETAVGANLFDHVWSVGWHEYLLDMPLSELPSAGPDTVAVTRRANPARDVPADVVALGRDVRDAAVAILAATHS